MSKDEEVEFRVLMLPMFLVASVGVIMLVNSWGRWAVSGDPLYVTLYYKSKYQTAFDAVMGGSFMEVVAGALLGAMYVYTLWVYVKPVFKRKSA